MPAAVHQIVKLFHKDGANRIDLYFLCLFQHGITDGNDLLIIVAVNQMLFIQDGMMQCGKEAAGGLRYEIKHITVKQIEDTVQLCKAGGYIPNAVQHTIGQMLEGDIDDIGSLR